MHLLRTLPAALALAALVTSPAVLAQAKVDIGDTPLIARSALFGNPVKSGAQLSPDGKWLTWMAPLNGVMNVWAAPVDQPTKAKPLTDSKDRPIPGYGWSGNSEQVLFVQDKGGDENYRLYGVNVTTGAKHDYTPFDKVRAQTIGGSRKRLDEMLVGINNRDPRWHDVYLLNLKSGELKLVMQGDGFAGFVSDDDLQVRLAARPNAAGGMDYFSVTDGKVADKPTVSTGLEDVSTSPLGLTVDGKTLYWTDSRERDTTALFAEDLATGQRKLIAQDARADLGGTLRDPVTGVVQAYAVEYLVNEWKFLDASLKADFEWLQRQLGQGDVIVANRTRADDKWIVSIDRVSKVAATYLFDRKAKQLTELYISRPELVGAPLVPMIPVEIKSRDGLTLPSYLTLPKGADKNGDGKADKPVPMVLFVHGGPWARDGYGYNSYHQWLANRGYAVLDTVVSHPRVTMNHLAPIIDAYRQLNNMPKLETALVRLTQLTPQSPEAWYELANTRIAQTKTAEAFVAISNAITLSNARRATDPKANDLATLARGDGNLASLQAMPEFQKLLAH